MYNFCFEVTSPDLHFFLHIFSFSVFLSGLFFWHDSIIKIALRSFGHFSSRASERAFQVASNSRLRSSDCFSVSSKEDIIICLLWRHSSRWWWWWWWWWLESTLSSNFVVEELLLLWLLLDTEFQSVWRQI